MYIIKLIVKYKKSIFNLSNIINNYLIKYKKNNKGNATLIFALCLIPIVIIMGFTVDYGLSFNYKSRLQNYLDGATLAGVSFQASTDEYGYGYSARKSRVIIRNKFWSTVRSDQHLGNLEIVHTNWDVQYDGHTISANTHVRARYKTIMSGLLGLSYMYLDIRSSAHSAPPSYISVIAIVDVSGSMSIGASQSDQVTMVNTTGCQFACHNDNRDLVRSKGAKLRIDVVRSALREMATNFQSLGGDPEQYQMALYTFDNSLNVLQSPTTNINKYISSLESLDTSYRVGMGTNFTYSINNLYNNYLPESYDGATKERRRVFILLFSDGIEDAVYELGNGNWIQDPNYSDQSPQFTYQKLQSMPLGPCSQLKNRHSTVLTLDTEYVIPYLKGDSRDAFLKNDLVPTIKNNMQDCASESNLAYSANSADEITLAVRKMFIQIRQKVRLTS